jgi:hypothetical protein
MTHVFFYEPIREMVLGLSGCHPNNELPTGQLQLSQDEICSLSQTLDNMIQIPSLKDEKSLAVLRKKLIRPTPDQPILLEVSDFRKIFELMEWWLPVEFFAATKLERFTLQWRKECYERGCQDISEYTKTIPTKPQDPCFLKPEHAQCAEKVKALEDSLQEWNNWAARLAYPLLDEFLVKEMAKLGKTPKDILTNAVPKLVAMRKEQEKELLEDKTRMEKFCTSAVKREAESRKKNDELRSEIRTKERQLRDREEGLKIQEADFKALQWKNQKTLQKESKVSDAQLRIEQDKVADLEKRLHTSNEALRTLQLDYDSVSTDLQELKLSDSANKAKISSESDQQGSIDKLKEDLQRYRGLYQATRSNEAIIQGRIDKAVREKNQELSVLREELEASQKKSSDRSMEYEAKLLADLATRDETIQDLSRANIGLRDTTSTQDAEIMRLKESRAAAVKLLLY